MDYAALRGRAEAHGQAHIFAFWDSLTVQEKEHLAAQAAGVDFALMERLVGELGQVQAPAGDLMQRLRPAPVIALPKTPREARAAHAARRAGEAALRAGRVGCFVVAGGQGTRLGLSGPKGTFDVGPVRKRSLFQLHAEKVMALRQRYGAALPFVVMTSDATDAATRAFFEEMFYLGMGEETVRFARQDNMPAVGRDGKLLLESRSSLALSPNGHGGAIKALKDSGALDWLRSQGVDTVFYFQVDNMLVRICDPVFIGFHLEAGAEMSSKVSRKRDWRERLGVIGLLDGKTTVIEYSDLPDAEAQRTEPDGSLHWWAGSIAIHVLDLGFAERLNAGGFQLPYHRAEKPVACIGPDGAPVRLKAGEKNAIKFETFIFDALPVARAPVTLETDRASDFAPIKNATGEDSPETARAALTELWARWLTAAGHKLPRRPDGTLDCRLDISPLTSLEGENLKKLKIAPIKPGSDVAV
jgi:UDP-N-acetylglucosamine/UDP-N-acetylgalactosamine diphosphorylase